MGEQLETRRQRIYELIASTRSYYGDYHDRKEQMAYGATALYLTGATALMVVEPFWEKYLPRYLAGFFLLLVVTGIVVGVFVWWQLDRRRWAADIVSACVNVLSQWNPDALSEEDLKAADLQRPTAAATAGAVKLPGVLVQEFRRNKANRTGFWLPREVALGLMAVWSLAAMSRVWSLWGGVMAGTNWWSAGGLLLDVVGAVGLAFSVKWLSQGRAVTQWWEHPTRVRWALGISGALLVLGFALQFLGQFPAASWPR